MKLLNHIFAFIVLIGVTQPMLLGASKLGMKGCHPECLKNHSENLLKKPFQKWDPKDVYFFSSLELNHLFFYKVLQKGKVPKSMKRMFSSQQMKDLRETYEMLKGNKEESALDWYGSCVYLPTPNMTSVVCLKSK